MSHCNNYPLPLHVRVVTAVTEWQSAWEGHCFLCMVSNNAPILSQHFGEKHPSLIALWMRTLTSIFYGLWRLPNGLTDNMPSKWTNNLKGYPPWWRQKTFAWTGEQRKHELAEHLTIVHPLPLSVCAVHWGLHDFSATPLLSPKSTAPPHVPRASWKSVAQRWLLLMDINGNVENKTNTSSLWHEHSHTY